MRNLATVFLNKGTTILLLIACVITACSSDDDGPAEAPVAAFSANINGVFLRSENATATINSSRTQLTLEGQANNGSDRVTIVFGPVVGQIDIGTYETGGDFPLLITYTSGQVTYQSRVEDAAVLEITAIDYDEENVFATFNGLITNTMTAEDQITIFSGRFNDVQLTAQ